VLRELGADVEAIGVNPDGLNINKDAGSTKPKLLAETVLKVGADLGVAFDGDGDRVIFVDEKGQIVDGDQILYIIVKDRLRTKGSCSGVVGTLMTNYGFELALSEMDIPFARANVGDRFVNELMHEKTWSIGGENSGHVICSDVTTTGDGIIAALKVFYALGTTGKKLSELLEGLTMMPQVMINVPRGRDVDLTAEPKIDQAVTAAEKELNGSGRVLLRPSGTEPLVRVMVEGRDAGVIQNLAEKLAEQVKSVLN
jgi:phosphoglucosamine mutase